MARYMEPTEEQIQMWNEWIESRPECVRKIAEKFEPWSLYRLKTSGHRVTLYSISEDGTMTVTVSGEFNQLLHDRNVFGIHPNELESCELPDEDEHLGSMLSNEEVDENIDALRVAVRPDLWEFDEDGNAVKKISIPIDKTNLSEVKFGVYKIE